MKKILFALILILGQCSVFASSQLSRTVRPGEAAYKTAVEVYSNPEPDLMITPPTPSPPSIFARFIRWIGTAF